MRNVRELNPARFSSAASGVPTLRRRRGVLTAVRMTLRRLVHSSVVLLGNGIPSKEARDVLHVWVALLGEGSLYSKVGGKSDLVPFSVPAAQIAGVRWIASWRSWRGKYLPAFPAGSTDFELLPR